MFGLLLRISGIFKNDLLQSAIVLVDVKIYVLKGALLASVSNFLNDSADAPRKLVSALHGCLNHVQSLLFVLRIFCNQIISSPTKFGKLVF